MLKRKLLVTTLAMASLAASMVVLPGRAFAQDAAPAASPAAVAPAAAAPTPTLEQRVAGLEAYIGNGDPSASLKDASGTIPTGLTTATVGVPGPGHNGWMMVASALVLMMTLPGLALFYGGLVRSKNVLSIVAMCFGITGLVTILWWAVGYSLVFGTSFGTTMPGISPFLGGTENFFFSGVTSAPNTNYSYWVSQNVFSIFQLTFAIITPALIFGASAERMKFSAVMLYVFLWMFVVYFPLAHMVWGATGFMNGVWNGAAKIPAIDFAGGTVVHMSSGWSSLILCMVLGKRLGFGKEPMPPHSMVACMIGTALLWVGWYGFNAGSAVAADVVSANAFTTTTLATAVASFVWAVMEWMFKGKPSILGFCSGAVAGLVVITPACGFVNATGGVIIGVAAGIIPFLTVTYMKPALGYDDALDTFGVHAIGGTLGALLTGFLATSTVNGNLAVTTPANYATTNGCAAMVANGTLWIAQLEAIGVTLALAIVGSLVISFIVKLTIGLRPAQEDEAQGLDITEHGEEGYILN